MPCAETQRCPIATIEPLEARNESDVTSEQPKILLSRKKDVWTVQKVVYIVTTVALGVLSTLFISNLLLKPHDDRMRRLDVLFTNAHEAGFYSNKVGFSAQKKKPAVQAAAGERHVQVQGR